MKVKYSSCKQVWRGIIKISLEIQVCVFIPCSSGTCFASSISPIIQMRPNPANTCSFKLEEGKSGSCEGNPFNCVGSLQATTPEVPCNRSICITLVRVSYMTIAVARKARQCII